VIVVAGLVAGSPDNTPRPGLPGAYVRENTAVRTDLLSFLRMPAWWWMGLLLVLASFQVPAHEVPDDVRLQVFFKPAGTQLQLLIRVPLAAMQEVDFPRRGPGYLDLAQAEPALRTAAQQWLADNLAVFEDGRRLPPPTLAEARASLPSDRSFAAYGSALAHLRGERLPAMTDLYWNEGLLDVLFEFPIASDRAAFAIEPGFKRLGQRVVTALIFLPPEGPSRAFEFHGNPGRVHLDPRWIQVAGRFVVAGFEHILEGSDHLLFIACLVIPLRRWRPLVGVVTGFTVAHSLTLVAAASGWVPDGLWFPPLVELLIAASIVFMALENIVGTTLRRRWILACAFGLAHGFGFSFALRESLQFAGSHLLSSLLAFNVGVELGQLLVLLVLVPLLQLLFRFGLAERLGVIILSAFVAHSGWHWLLERGERLARFPWPWAAADSAVVAMRTLLVLLLVAGGAWAWRGWRGRH